MASDRFFIIPPERLPSPAKCWCCGATKRPCVDWGADIAYMGAVLLCITCLAEAATLLPASPDHEKESLKMQVKQYEKIFGDLRDALDSANSAAASALQFARMGDVSSVSGAPEFLAKAGR